MKPPHTLALESEARYGEVFGDLYEHSPWVIANAYARVKSDSRFDDIAEFHRLLAATMLDAPEALQDALIKAHPMLAGKEAQEGKLTDFSTGEQRSAGLNSCTNAEIERFNLLNKRYFDTFGFPYILAVKGRSKEEIVSDFERRLRNDYRTERAAALEQINTIALIRIKDIYEK